MNDEKFIAIDIGLKRIGLAFGFKGVVVPLTPILRKNRNQASRDISRVLGEYNADILVVGVPIGGSSEDEMRRRILHFVSLLDFTGKIIYQDESFSSFEAADFVKDKRDGKLDSMAALIILKRYLQIPA
ncbi:Holliday junction resolvase RuvX [Campylobacter pinnipediorum]|uniref:Putative pre-16S rRNA nuclease n=1 Tax=Campylobacter pinnipediorum subsp. pinnipediorum TaxID=1660067 RepID=A0AAX0L8T8_9BACT|nr:Holliday junction resolvase RuvX [Campylobacter pinnipediorum]AQW82268.1 Holliday junction resolvase-like protein (UPF0081 domain) [Campylobacter pinnipediorum subsp. pinnipediorum]AQW83945.1 Holliday junction resolvase-like protein (UPF0081 domain) [Campylobacter pinnipediorum subsp. pinnipediorum]OPA75072.1 Holliday junction DNA helicase RuvA [Campylobacter pinnipediorum subsp. pinnipediorum]